MRKTARYHYPSRWAADTPPASRRLSSLASRRCPTPRRSRDSSHRRSCFRRRPGRSPARSGERHGGPNGLLPSPKVQLSRVRKAATRTAFPRDSWRGRAERINHSAIEGESGARTTGRDVMSGAGGEQVALSARVVESEAAVADAQPAHEGQGGEEGTPRHHQYQTLPSLHATDEGDRRFGKARVMAYQPQDARYTGRQKRSSAGCIQFFAKGTCAYGSRCKFSHDRNASLFAR